MAKPIVSRMKLRSGAITRGMTSRIIARFSHTLKRRCRFQHGWPDAAVAD